MAVRREEGARALEALGSPLRREILQLLSAGERSVGELSDCLPVSRPAVSRHLRLLENAGLVEFSEEGTSNIYRVSRRGFAEAEDWLGSFWDNALERLRLVAENTTPPGTHR